MINHDDHNRMRWASRRGLLELDFLLDDFVANASPRLSEHMKELYKVQMSSVLLELIGGMYQEEMINGNKQLLQIHQSYSLNKSLVIHFMEEVIH